MSTLQLKRWLMKTYSAGKSKIRVSLDVKSVGNVHRQSICRGLGGFLETETISPGDSVEVLLWLIA